MERKTMTLTRILTELKNIKAKFNDGITRFSPVTYKVGNKLATQGVSEDDFIKNAQAALNSATDLTNYRYKLKRALNRANATTMVKIANMEPMTIAEAIDYKDVLAYKRTLLNHLRREYDKVTRKMESVVADNDSKLNQMVNTMLGQDNSVTTKESSFKNLAEQFGLTNKVAIVDPCGVMKLIDALSKEINDFEADVDASLSEINSKTEVVIE